MAGAAGAAAQAEGAREQIKEFLRFFSSKRELYMREVDGVFEDVRDANLGETMYSLEDVGQVIDAANASVKDSIRQELERESQMAALVLEQVMAHAVNAGVTLAVDMSKTEDAAALAEVGKMKLLDLQAAREASQKLTSVRSERQQLVDRVAELEQANAAGAQREAELQTQLAALQREKGALVRRAEDAEAAAGVASASAEQLREADELRRRVASLQTELEDAQAAAAQAQEAAATATPAQPAVTQTKQFQALKQMLTKKNAQLVDLRRRLQRYEPDDARAVDEAGETPLQPKQHQ